MALQGCVDSHSSSTPNRVLLASVEMDIYPFRRWFQDALQIDEIEQTHMHYPANVATFVQLTEYLREKCEHRITILKELLDGYCRDVIESLFGRIVARQKEPTLRIYLAVDDATLAHQRRASTFLPTEEFLRKFYAPPTRAFHRDADYGVPPNAVNLWLPVTKVFGANSLWIGGRDQRGQDATPIDLEIGQALFFNGSQRWHGSVWNTTGHTRVSFDWRFIPETDALL
jgi:hypothetical protein